MHINKYYSIYKGIHINNIIYFMVKYWRKFRICFIRDKKLKKIEKDIYLNDFKKNSSIHNSNKIPKNKYYIPISFVVFDIIPKERIIEFGRGLECLILKHSTKNIIFNTKHIDSFVQNINDYSWSSDARYNFGRFDFEDNNMLTKHIDYFNIIVRNFSASYFAIEINVYLSEKRKKEIIEVINNDYKARGQINKYFAAIRKHTKKRRIISHYNDDTLKSELINNKFIETKWILFNELKKFFPLTLHHINIIPPSINIYKTNISYIEQVKTAFWVSVGVLPFNGQFLYPSKKFFFKIEARKPSSDLLLIANEETEPKLDMYHNNFDFQINSFVTDTLSEEILRFIITKIICEKYLSVYSKYRNINNTISYRRASYKKILKIRNSMEIDFNMFTRICSEINWDDELKRNPECFKIRLESRHYQLDFNRYKKSSFDLLKKIESNYEKLKESVDQKVFIAQHRNEYTNARKNYRLNLIMLLMTVLTFLIILYPSFGNAIISFIKFITTLIGINKQP